MTNNMKLFLEDPAKFIDGLSPLVVILTSLGIIVTIMLFIFFLSKPESGRPDAASFSALIRSDAGAYAPVSAGVPDL